MARTPEEQRNHALVMEWFEAVLQPLDSRHVDRYMHRGYVQHSALAATGPEGLKSFLDEQHALFPNARIDLKRSFVDGDHVTCHYHVKRFAKDPGLAVIDIFRVDGDRIAEHWEAVQEIPASIPHDNGMF